MFEDMERFFKSEKWRAIKIQLLLKQIDGCEPLSMEETEQLAKEIIEEWIETKKT